MRELSVQASNGTNAKEDLVAIQNEINQLTEEVDRIANTTEFNNISLLNRNNISEEDLEIIISNLKKWWLVEAENLVEDGYGITANKGDEENKVGMQITFSNDSRDSVFASVSVNYNVDKDGELTVNDSDLVMNINLAYAKPITPENTDGGKAPYYIDRVVGHEMVHAVMASTMNYGSLPIWFKEGTAEFIHGADERLLGDISMLGGGIDLASGMEKQIKEIVSNIHNISGKSNDITPLGYSTAYIATRYLDWQIRKTGLEHSGTEGHSDGIKLLMEKLAKNPGPTLDQVLGELRDEGIIGFVSEKELIAALQKDVNSYENLAKHTGIKLDYGMKEGYPVQADTGSIIGSSITGNDDDHKTAKDILPQEEENPEEKEQPLEGFKIDWSKDVAQPPIKLQIGSSEGQNIDIILSDMRARALGIMEDGKSLDVTDNEKAAKAITKFEDAIEIVSMERSKLGSYQNRLEHTIRNLDNTAENLQSAESRIADADMAIEMSVFTKLNILQQAGTSMLSQANDLPQSVLQLLK